MTEFDIDIEFTHKFKRGELKALSELANKDRFKCLKPHKVKSNCITGIYDLYTKKAYIVLKGYKKNIGFKEDDIIKRVVEDTAHEAIHFLIAENIGFHEVVEAEEKIVNLMVEGG